MPRHISVFAWLLVGCSPEWAAKVLTVISTDEPLTHANAGFCRGICKQGALKLDLTHIFIIAQNARGDHGPRWRKCNAVIYVNTSVSGLITRSCMKRNSTFDTLLLLFTQHGFCLCL